MSDEKTNPVVPAAPTAKLPPGAIKLPTCSCRVKIAKNGSDVLLHGVTPPEMLVLVAEHHREVGGNPISEIKPGEPVIVLPEQELGRLGQKYSSDKLRKLFNPANPTLIDSFERAQQVGVGANLSRSNLVDSGKPGSA